MKEVPTALAPTETLAHPKMEKFARKVAEHFGATIHRFYACEPCTKQVWATRSNDSPSWIVGDWGLELLCKDFSAHSLPARGVIDVEFIEVVSQPEHGMIVTLQLTARVMR